MKNFFLAFVMVFAISFSLSAQTAPSTKKAVKKEVKESPAKDSNKIVLDMSDNENGPKMEFESMTVDYGQIEQHSDKIRFLKFKNTGNEPLIISNARGSCGCTVPTWPKEPIAPGEESEIKVSYATNRLGKINKTITFTTNEGGKPHVVKVIGFVNKKEEAVPAKKEAGFGG